MVVLIALVVAVGFGLATDYEVFLVSRMVEARARGMSTAEAIRIGTATTGRLITAAALVLAVVAGSFVFSDLVMMKYLAFGLMAALLLDATVVRMFLVPSVMKLLGDDCWWAPHWMKRLQNRLGLGEIHLPDERKVPVSAGSHCAARGHHPPGHAGPPTAARPHPSQRRARAATRQAGHPAAAGAAARLAAAGEGRAAVGRGHRPHVGPGTARRGSDDPLFGSAESAGGSPARSPAGTRHLAATTARSSPGSATCAPARPANRAAPARSPRSRPPTKPGRCRSRRGTSRPARRPTTHRRTPPPRSPPRRAMTRIPTPPPRS